ncbi:hypothetical protein SUGI_0474820 [Cryptomeria japonica]|nr:hypothetical protein SUGI_0474820 [Cryptomeria japonica]
MNFQLRDSYLPPKVLQSTVPTRKNISLLINFFLRGLICFRFQNLTLNKSRSGLGLNSRTSRTCRGRSVKGRLVSTSRQGDDDGEVDDVAAGDFSLGCGYFMCEEPCAGDDGVVSKSPSLGLCAMVTSPTTGFLCDAWPVLGHGMLGECGGVCSRVGGLSLSPAGDIVVDWFDGPGP